MLSMPSTEELEIEKRRITEALHSEQQKLHQQLELKQQYLQQKEKFQAVAQRLQEAHSQALTKQKVLVERAHLELQVAQTTLKQLIQQQTLASQEKKVVLAQIAQQETLMAQYKKALVNHETLTRQFERRKDYYHKYIAQGNLLKTEQASIAQKKNLAHDETNPSCPLCEQNLSAARKRFLKQKFDEQEQFLAYRLQKISTIIQKLKIVLINQHEILKNAQKTAESVAALQAQLEQQIQTRDKLTQLETALEKQIYETKNQENKLQQGYAQEKDRLSLIEKEGLNTLVKDEEYTKLAQTAQLLEKEMARTTYDQKTYLALTVQLKQLEQQTAEKELIQKEFARQEQRMQDVAQLCRSLKKIKQEIQDINHKLIPFEQLKTEEQTLAQQEQELAQKQSLLGAQKDELIHKKGSLESQLLALEKLKKESLEHQELLANTETLISDYQAIAHAISKDGIQALLIEEAIPEIEQAANDILAKLTNNQAHISIESLKDLKKGGTRETLDINISDTSGLRSYELFSGGEAFRIDFALRIAISKLLARRAGTSLQTLIIDEGFGSQDEEGLTHMMNAIYAIQEDFSKIIIVSHLNSMKDQFPVHMIVEKEASGSKVTVFEQG